MTEFGKRGQWRRRIPGGGNNWEGVGRARRAEAGVGFLVRGNKASPHQLEGQISVVSSHSGVQGGAPAA